MEISDVITQIDQARASIYRNREIIISMHPDWKKNDARITAFSKCLHILNTTKLGLMLGIDSLKPERNEWWKEYYDTELDLPFTGVQYLNQFDIILRLGFIQFIFAAIESTFRPILKAIDPKACSGGTNSFANIYCCLLKILNLFEKWEPLLELLRHSRNSVHNNSVFLPPSQKDACVNYNGKQYIFKVGSKVDFLGWELLIGFLNDIEKMLIEVINNPQVLSLSFIDDPSIKV